MSRYNKENHHFNISHLRVAFLLVGQFCRFEYLRVKKAI